MDKKKIALIVVVLFLLIGLGSFVFANPDQDNDLEGPGVSEDGGSGDGEVIDGTEPTATPEEENDDSATETDPITTYGNGGNGTGTGAGNNGTTGGVGNTDMSQYDDARRIIEELENRVHSMQNKDDSNDAVDYRTDTGIIDMVNNLPEGTEKDELMNRLDAINKVLDDTTAPGITGINNNDVTKENVTINVTDDNDVTITATLDGEEIEFTTPLTEEGHYVVTVTDKNFNTTTVEFTIDTTPIALDWLYVLNNSGTDYKVIGDGQKLYVELVFSEEFTSIPMIQIGNAEAVEMSCHWTNWQTEKQYFKCDATITIDGSTMGLENGKEVPVKITNVLDAAENETVLTNENITETEKYGHVIYDKQAPEYEQLGIVDHVEWQDEVARAYAKLGDEVRIMIYFKELLAVNPTVKLGGKEFTATHRPDSDQNGLYAYYADIVLTKDMNLAEGIIPFEVYGYADEAGNVGVELTQDMTTSKEYPYVIYDSVAPGLNFNNGFITDAFTVVATDDNFDYMTVQYYDGREMKTITENTFTLDAEGDNIRYNIKAYDKAGNVSEYADIYLDTQPPVLSGTGINGKNEVEVKDGGYYKNATIHFEDGSLKKVVLVNEDDTEEVLEEYEDNYTTSKMVFDRTFPEDGTYTIKAIDRKGNETVVTFTIDNVEPGPRVVGITGFFNEAEGADAHYITTGEGVRILTYYNEKLGTAPMVKIGNKEFQTYYAEQSSSEENGSYAYYADIKITKDLGLSDGEIQFSIYGHKDAAGNEGRAYTNADVTYTESSPYEIRYDKVILDNVAPEFNVTSGTHGATSMDITITDVNFDYAVVVNQDNGDRKEVKDTVISLTEQATYHICAYDKAGNVTDLWVAIDKDSPTITIQGNVDDNENRYYNTDVTVNVFDKFLTTVTIDGVTYNRDSFTADSKNENFKFETVVSGAGEHTVTAVDKYGHENTVTFTIDMTDPVISKVPENNKKVNYSVSPAVSDNYGVASVTLLKDGEVVEGYGLDNMYELSHDGIYELTVTDYAGNSATATFTIDKTAPTFDFSAIPSTFEVGIDSYTYPENGVVVDNFDEPRGFGNVHMLWYKLNDDGTRTAVEPFEWNTDLSNRELGQYVITYRTYDEAGNEAKDERIVTLQDTTPATIIPNRPEVSDFIQGVDTYDTETGVAYDNYDQIGFSAINIEYYLKNADGTETHVDYFAKPSSLEDEVPGVYRIHYWYRDANGNYSQVNRIFNLKNMDDINRVQSLVSTAETMLNDGTKTIEEIQHSIDVALQEANKLPEFTEKTEFLNQITNLQNILNNRKQYNKVNDYFNQLKSSWYGNESNENVQYYIDVINQQINSFTGYETERQNIINGTAEIQDALNNRKAYQNVVSYLEKAQEANRNGDDESLQNYIDIVKQQINSFTGYETERENILNKVNILQEVKNNRHNYNLLLEYYHNAVDSYNNGEDKQTIQYYIDVTKQQLNRVDNYETEKSNIEKSIQELQEKVNNM